MGWQNKNKGKTLKQRRRDKGTRTHTQTHESKKKNGEHKNKCTLDAKSKQIKCVTKIQEMATHTEHNPRMEVYANGKRDGKQTKKEH